jgi:hypothetical protein
VYEIPGRSVIVHVLKSPVDVAPEARSPIACPLVVRVNKASLIVLPALTAGPATRAVKQNPANASLIPMIASPPVFVAAGAAWLTEDEAVETASAVTTMAANRRVTGMRPIRLDFMEILPIPPHRLR